MECIRLSTENKINSKNAFLLKLNSLTSTETWTSEGETDFKMAGMAVDASAKIYAGRVDSVHQDTYSVLGTLGSRQSGSEAERGPGAPDKQTEGEKTSGQTRNKSKGKSKLDKPENLTLRSIEREYYMDPILQRLAAAADEEGANGLLAVQLPMEERYFQLKLDPSEPYSLLHKSPWEECAHRTGSECVKKLFRMWEAIDLSPAPICPSLVGHAFNSKGQFVKMSGENGEGHPESETMEETESHSPNRSISPEICLPGMDNSFESPDNSAAEQEPIPSPPPSPMTSINRVLELLDPTEFSYLSADTLKQLRKEEERFSSARSKSARPEAKGSKTGNTRGARKCKLIDFSSQLTAAALELSKSRKAISNTDGSVEAKAEQKSFYKDEDLSAGYNSRQLFSLFLVPSVSVKLSRESARLAGSEDLEGEASYYNYDAETDISSYIPLVNPVAEDARADSGGTSPSLSLSPSRPNTDISMVAAPVIPEKIQLNFDRRPKYVNMKALKERMWALIEDRSVPDTRPVGFSQLTESLLVPTEAKPSEHLSKALLFATLLHLANEHSLLLEQPDHSADVRVFRAAE